MSTPTPRSDAAAATERASSVRSSARLPESPTPRSASTSTCTEATFPIPKVNDFTVPAARRIRSPNPHDPVTSRRAAATPDASSVRNAAAVHSASRRASSWVTAQPLVRPRVANSFNKTVLPTPRSPARPARVRASRSPLARGAPRVRESPDLDRQARAAEGRRQDDRDYGPDPCLHINTQL